MLLDVYFINDIFTFFQILSCLLRHAPSLPPAQVEGLVQRAINFLQTDVSAENVAMAPNALAEMCHQLADELVRLPSLFYIRSGLCKASLFNRSGRTSPSWASPRCSRRWPPSRRWDRARRGTSSPRPPPREPPFTPNQVGFRIKLLTLFLYQLVASS